MAGNPCPPPGGPGGAGVSGFPVAHYSYFFPHMLGGLSPPILSGMPVSGYSTPSPVITMTPHTPESGWRLRPDSTSEVSAGERRDSHVLPLAMWVPASSHVAMC
ncbi:hypothetical protein DPEC_G00275500 [Dallia pectoralis]|uniref:Uncharacterized protein n=1 Tax=Dallia pectoralis TaxID=75939 RepID=A0ACC2FLK6_DALPE|nr:hypothetical protein DPEC_G00275500 [Dallia pectoralis]